ncbi:anti-sigma factor family protein [Cumulibacter manganitolerans]|uniref:anti-sigma factor family protein n=1 Tax=Cumulibacter manganitolerans TaxID=1884992 RepID=UPI001297B4E9|nr:zf-HC2 domain-containing protein [Cumulibacter manganitolerans]
MTSAPQPHPFASYDAAYVLGALTEDDRAAYRSHLEECPDCQAAVARLAALPRLLARVESAEEVPGPGAAGDPVRRPLPDTLLPGILRAARRSRLRRRVAAGAVAATLAAGLVTGTALVASHDTPAPQGRQVALSTITAAPVEASLSIRETAWGAELTMDCRYLGYAVPPDAAYELVVVPHSGGTPQTVARWKVLPGRDAHVVGSTDLPPDQIQQVQVQTSTGEILLHS